MKLERAVWCKKNLFYDCSGTGKSTSTSKVQATVRRKIQIFKFIMLNLLLRYDTIPVPVLHRTQFFENPISLGLRMIKFLFVQISVCRTISKCTFWIKEKSTYSNTLVLRGFKSYFFSKSCRFLMIRKNSTWFYRFIQIFAKL